MKSSRDNENKTGEEPSPTGLRGIARALRHRNYKLFFFGQGTSLIGSWMQGVALSWLVYRLTGSQVLLGVVGFASQIPTFLFAPLAGVLADRVNRRRLLLVTQSLAMLQAFLLAALTIAGVINTWEIIVLSMVLGMVMAFDIPTRQAFVIEMIESRQDLPNAIALNSFVVNGARLVGPSLAGLIIVAAGEGVCFLVNALSFLAVLVALLAMKNLGSRAFLSGSGDANHQMQPDRGQDSPLATGNSRFFHNLREGVTYVFSNRPIRGVLLLLATVSLLGFPYMVLMPVFAKDILGGGAETLGIMMGAAGAGALCGAFFLAWRSKGDGLIGIMAGATALFGCSLLAFGLSRILWLSLAILVVAGFAAMIQIAGSNTFVQTVVDDDKRGRVMSFHTMCFMGMGPFGSLLIAFVSSRLTAPVAVMVAGACCIMAAIIFASRLAAARKAQVARNLVYISKRTPGSFVERMGGSTEPSYTVGGPGGPEGKPACAAWGCEGNGDRETGSQQPVGQEVLSAPVVGRFRAAFKEIDVKKKTIIIVAVAATALVAGGYFLLKPAEAKDPNAQVSIAVTERGDIRQAVTTNGRVVANLDVDIKCKASGQIIKLPFDVSDEVKAGELLVELDPVDMGRVLEQAKVRVGSSQAKQATANKNLEIAVKNLATSKTRAESAFQSAQASAKDARAKNARMKQLWDKKLVSQEECDTAETSAVAAMGDLNGAEVALKELEAQEAGLEVKRQDVKLAESQVRSDTIDCTIAEDRLKDTKVVSPMNGVVSARNVQTGQIISSGTSNVGGGTTILTLSDLSRIFVLASVDESDIGKVKEGQEAGITADAFPGREFSGKVVRIATKGVSASTVVTFEVKIEVTSQQKKMLKPEMTANVDIIAAERQDVVTVPVEAVTRKGKQHYATVIKDGANQEREVTVGISDGLKTEIVSGLKEGETVQVRKAMADSQWNGGQRGGSRLLMGGGGGRRHDH